MTAAFHVTYSIVTPESAADGDAAETGFAMPGGWRDSIDVALREPASAHDIGLRAAVDLCGGPFIDCGRWFDVADPTPDYRTGSDTSYSLHPPRGITAASYARLARLLAATR